MQTQSTEAGELVGSGADNAMRQLGRERLSTELLRFRSSRASILAVWGSAGAGKTVLLEQWARRLASIGDRVERLPRDGAHGRATPPRARPPDSDHYMDWLFVDDVHVATSSEVDELLATNADAGPRRIVLAGRFPPSGFDLRVSGDDVIALHTDDLAFTAEETVQLARLFGLALDDEDAEVLVRRTGGWAAGLALAMPYFAAQPDVRKSVERFSGDQHPVADYLISRVLDILQPDESELLLRSAVGPTIPMDLAVVLSHRPDAGAVLSRLSSLNLFVAEDRERAAFVCHPVLLSFIQAEARRRDEAAALSAHLRAAAWYEDRDDHAAALEQVVMTDSPHAIREQLERSGMTLLLDGRASIVVSALRALPSLQTTLPIAVLRLAMDLPVYPDRIGAMERVTQIERLLTEAPGELRAEWSPYLPIFRVFLSTDPDSAIAAVAELREAMATTPSVSPGEALLVSLAEAWAGVIGGFIDEARDALRAVENGANRAGFLWLAAMACDLDAQLSARRGNWRAVAAAEERELAVGLDSSPPFNRASARAVLVRATRTFWRGEAVNLAPIRRILAADPTGSELGLSFPCRVLSLAVAIDESPHPREQVGQLLALIRDEGHKNHRSTAAAAVRTTYWAQRTYGPEAAAEACRAITEAVGPEALESHLTRYLAANHHDYAAEQGLLNHVEGEPVAWSGTSVVNAWILLAERANETGRLPDTVSRLTAALRFAEEYGFGREFLARRGAGAKLVLKYLGSFGPLEEYAEHVLALGHAQGLELSQPEAAWPALTTREIELLHELPTHQTVAAIAAKRHVSVNTVKTHLRSIYLKLSVSGRTEAIEVARRRELI